MKILREIINIFYIALDKEYINKIIFVVCGFAKLWKWFIPTNNLTKISFHETFIRNYKYIIALLFGSVYK